VLADDNLSSCGVLDLDQLCGNVSHNPDELEMGGQVAYDCQYVPTCSEVMKYMEKYDHFLHSNTHVPEKVEKIILNPKMYTVTVVVEKCKRKTTLDKYFTKA